MMAVREQGSLAHLLSAGRHLILHSAVASSQMSAVLLASEAAPRSKIELVISRSRAAKYSGLGLVDTEGRWSIFGQMLRRLHAMPPSIFRRKGQVWDTVFAGERAQDAGGPYRECWAAICQELMSPALPMLCQCPNGSQQVGLFRDTWVLNPDMLPLSIATTTLSLLDREMLANSCTNDGAETLFGAVRYTVYSTSHTVLATVLATLY